MLGSSLSYNPESCQLGMCGLTGGLHSLCHEWLLVPDKDHYFAPLTQYVPRTRESEGDEHLTLTCM